MFPNAPLAYVTVEVRFPGDVAQPIAPVVQRAFRDSLGEDWVVEQITQSSLAISIQSGMAPAQTGQTTKVPRFTNRARTWAVVATASSLVVETTEYRHWPEFQSVLERALVACSGILNPEGVVRVGMRYIDEIRIPTADDFHPIVWSEWLAPSLFAPEMIDMSAEGFQPLTWTGAAQFDTGVDRQLVLRYGPNNGYAVNPAGPLRRHNPPLPGPIFVLDFDSFWQPSEIPAFSPADLMTTCEELRNPMRTLFDRLIPEKLLDEVFRKEA